MTMATITKSLLLPLGLCLSLMGCSELTGGRTGANDLPTDQQDDLVGGIGFKPIVDGKFLFEGTMDNGGDSGHNFEVSLKLEEGKKAQFWFFADKQLSQGVGLAVEKVADDAVVTVSVNEVSHSIALPLSDDNTLDISIDIHNDHEDAHILIWNLNGPFGDAEECVEDEACLYNTEFFTDPNPGPWGSQGRGPGSFWGFEGDKEMILKLSLPKGAKSNA